MTFTSRAHSKNKESACNSPRVRYNGDRIYPFAVIENKRN